MRPSIEVDDFIPLRKILEYDHYKFCYEEILTQCYFRTVDFEKYSVFKGNSVTLHHKERYLYN